MDLATNPFLLKTEEKLAIKKKPNLCELITPCLHVGKVIQE